VIAPDPGQFERDFLKIVKKIKKIPPSMDANRSQQVHNDTYQMQTNVVPRGLHRFVLALRAEWFLKY
jgi:hypothetical protein